MSNVSKGYRTEKHCADELKAEGYLVWKTIRHKFLNIDLWGLFDVVALHPEGKHILFIQCKTNGLIPPAKREELKKLKMPDNCEKWGWSWYDRKGWRKIKF